MSTPVTAIIGVGPGTGTAIARRFAREGHAIALVARSRKSLDPAAKQLAAAGARAISVEADATKPDDIARAFERIRGELGAPDVVVYNAGAFQMGGILDITPEQFEQCWKANCEGAFLAARAALPAMLERGAGTLLFTGATAGLRGSAKFACLAVGKFGLRALAQSIARELGPRGIHVAHVIVDGQIDTPMLAARAPERAGGETVVAPDGIAEAYWQLHVQPKSAWTHEFDLRPHVEKW